MFILIRYPTLILNLVGHGPGSQDVDNKTWIHLFHVNDVSTIKALVVEIVIGVGPKARGGGVVVLCWSSNIRANK